MVNFSKGSILKSYTFCLKQFKSFIAKGIQKRIEESLFQIWIIHSFKEIKPFRHVVVVSFKVVSLVGTTLHAKEFFSGNSGLVCNYSKKLYVENGHEVVNRCYLQNL